MKRTVITAALLAAFAMPALADETIRKNDVSTPTTRIDKTTTASTKQQSEIAPTVIDDNMYGGCMHHRNTALNMM